MLFRSSLQMKLRNYIYSSYNFVYKIPDITIFNQSEVIDEELKLAQASIPNKMKLCATAGISPTALLGNTFVENKVFKNIFDIWQPLRSSYTEAGDSGNEGGRPEKEDTEISEVTEVQRGNDSNDVENRI